MHHPSAKDFFLSALGVHSIPAELNYHDIAFQRHSENEPFCVIKMQKNGDVILRVNPWDTEDTIKYIL